MEDSVYAIIKNNPELVKAYVEAEEERVKHINFEFTEEEMKKGLADIKERLILQNMFGY